MKNLGTIRNVTTWQMEESDIPKIPMPIRSDILHDQPERLNPETPTRGCDSLNSMET
jgi:hypothetical protein